MMVKNDKTLCNFCMIDVIAKIHIGKCSACGGELHIRENESECGCCGRVTPVAKVAIAPVVPTSEQERVTAG
jgi:hypothetical protein